MRCGDSAADPHQEPHRMKHSIKPLILGLAVAFAAPAAWACPAHEGRAWTDAEVRTHLAAQGFRNINDVNFKEGVWTADALSQDGKHVELTLDPTSGKVVTDEGIATISRTAVTAILSASGYT